jgi:hypothetical protein
LTVVRVRGLSWRPPEGRAIETGVCSCCAVVTFLRLRTVVGVGARTCDDDGSALTVTTGVEDGSVISVPDDAGDVCDGVCGQRVSYHDRGMNTHCLRLTRRGVVVGDDNGSVKIDSGLAKATAPRGPSREGPAGGTIVSCNYGAWGSSISNCASRSSSRSKSLIYFSRSTFDFSSSS